MKLIINTCYGGFSLSEKAKNYCGYNDITGFDFDKVRINPKLIEFIQKEGWEVASGQYAHLTIVTIPKGTKYYIDDYDGFESIITENDIDWQIAD